MPAKFQSLKNLLTNENDLHNCSTRSSANHQFALPQVKNTNYGLYSIRYRTAKHWSSVQNTLNLNFANNFVPPKNSLKHSRKIFTLTIQHSCDLFKGIQLTLYMPFSISQTRIMKVLKYYFKLFTTAFRQII